MNDNHTFWIVNEGKTLDVIHQLVKEREAQAAVIEEIIQRFGAEGTYGSENGISGLIFKTTAPKGWTAVRGTDDVYKPGRGMSVIKKELSKAKFHGAKELHRRLTGDGFGGTHVSSDVRGLKFASITTEQIGDRYVLIVPISANAKRTGQPDKYQPENCTQIKTSEYYRMKEELECSNSHSK